MRRNRTRYRFHFDDDILDIVPNYKYLGIILDEHLTYEKCSRALAESGGRALGAIWSKFKLMKNVGYNTYTKMFDTGVVPVLDYGSGIWGHSKFVHSEIIQNRAIRYYLGVHNFTPVPVLQGEMGWLTCKYRKPLNMIRLWNRIVKMPHDRTPRLMMEYEHSSSFENWTKKVGTLFRRMNMGHIYEQKLPCHLDTVREHLLKLNEADWGSVITTKPKLRNYIEYKHEFKKERYVVIINNKIERSLVAKLRCGILKLKIETGRFINLPLNERICELCDTGDVEDEKHFVCICPRYSNERRAFYETLSNIDPSFSRLDSTHDVFNYIVKNVDKTIAKFVLRIWNLRTNFLYNRNPGNM